MASPSSPSGHAGVVPALLSVALVGFLPVGSELGLTVEGAAEAEVSSHVSDGIDEDAGHLHEQIVTLPNRDLRLVVNPPERSPQSAPALRPEEGLQAAVVLHDPTFADDRARPLNQRVERGVFASDVAAASVDQHDV